MIQVPQPKPPLHDLPGIPVPDGGRIVASAARKVGWLRKHADYQRVYKATRKQFSASMTWFVAPREAQAASKWMSDPGADPAAGPRVGLTVGKVVGKAHERNRIKRRMREVVRKHLGRLPHGVDLILHPRRAVMSMEFGKLDGEVLRIFGQAAAQVCEARLREGKAKPERTLELVEKSRPGAL